MSQAQKMLMKWMMIIDFNSQQKSYIDYTQKFILDHIILRNVSESHILLQILWEGKYVFLFSYTETLDL